MFTFGSFDATSTPGLAAVLVAWPGMPGVELRTVASPGRDGVFFADASLSAGSFSFDLVVVHADPLQALAIASAVTEALNPRLGQQALMVDVAPGWVWSAVPASLAEWERAGWRPGSECRLRSRVEFTCPDPYGYAIPDESWQRSTPGGLTVTRAKGNVESFPRIEVQATLTAGQSVTVTVGGRAVTVTGPLSSSQVLRLDYAVMDFGIWEGDTKVASAVPRMSSFERLRLPVGQTVTSVACSGTLHEFRIAANSRRI